MTVSIESPLDRPRASDALAREFKHLLSLRYRAAKASFYLWLALALAVFLYYCFGTLVQLKSTGWAAVLGFVVGTWLMIGSVFFGLLWATVVQLHTSLRDFGRWILACLRQAIFDLHGAVQTEVLIDVPRLEAQVVSLVSVQVAQWNPDSAFVSLVERWAPPTVGWGLRWIVSAVVGRAWVGERMTVADFETTLLERVDRTVLGTIRWALRLATIVVLVSGTVWMIMPFLVTWLGFVLAGHLVQ